MTAAGKVGQPWQRGRGDTFSLLVPRLLRTGAATCWDSAGESRAPGQRRTARAPPGASPPACPRRGPGPPAGVRPGSPLLCAHLSCSASSWLSGTWGEQERVYFLSPPSPQGLPQRRVTEQGFFLDTCKIPEPRTVPRKMLGREKTWECTALPWVPGGQREASGWAPKPVERLLELRSSTVRVWERMDATIF